MAKNLVIVESPAKAKTIEKFLGADFQVESSYGHIADLPSKEIGVDVLNGFTPKYEVSPDKKALVTKLKGLAKKADMVWLASDEDREGEAISWHLAEELKLDPKKTKRIVFHEITKTAILKAIENPREIDYNLVNAQQARRVLDRLVGYELSPVLWRKIKGGLSAGRVQSVSVRLIVEREREIINFKPVATYSVQAEFTNEAGKSFKAKLPKNFNTKKEAEDFLNKNIGSIYKVGDLETKPTKKTPAGPFTTSTLQQEAARKLYLPVGITMQLAQRLYEAGLITYMRTDSVNLSKDAMEAAQAEIIKSYGKEYAKPRTFVNKSKGAQEAHEAIRPTDMSRHTVNIDRDQARLYDLIWKRTLASQMADAELERTNVKIEANNHSELFTASGEVIKFEGFLKVYLEGHDDDEEEQEGMLPSMKVNEKLINNYITATERYSRAAARYTEASLVKKLEELGIGRPSTYAPTISTIINRNYVEKGNLEGQERNYTQLTLQSGKVGEKLLKENTGSDKGKLVPTDIGTIVTDFLVKNFDNILDYNFTAKVEQDFDEIAEGNMQWAKMMQDFYDKFHPTVKDVEANADRESGERILGIDPKSGKPVSVRLGKFGPMAQIGAADDEEKTFASLLKEQNIGNITLEEVLKLFLLPKNLGTYKGEEIEVSNGRYGPFIRFGTTFVSLPKGEEPLNVDLNRAQELIDEKLLADAPIAVYKGEGVQKGTGRFGPFLKWNGIFINVSTKYNFNNLSQQDIETIIEDKIQKNIDKVIHNWEAEGILVQKARWGRSEITKGKIKIELSKDFDVAKLTLAEAQEMIAKKTPVKKAPVKKAVAKKPAVKKLVAKKN
ncbi:type I DNA topoisomerase [Flavobacterium psychrophilum]|uniref:type I DNA topoisomerase n=1 Tax=Flavobacterium psychrophilum TaxID=96345 RepID=UPI000B7C362F|nr:type I DNA topoisomerase [Flavobacterium psychrophilum]EKT4498195.1 type I DNA topoisomerase [Flavobacterium psychrophilum]EKT4519288.1 type I DNA topoisomerase [Flavobacterium psychrophilum]EKT4552539.1 type I DNA topoisomerase [Flavobacterium psychrophilum]ELI6455207.1 type I DNA topoisomerase [Flavobacterium psychrophilum]ELM3649096.1 type I DNA topoisomerase [Flavobacterium psychrophilum]